MKIIKYCLLALLCPLLSMAQTHSIQGKLLNEDNQPLQAATIQVKNTGKITTTNNNGEFNFENISPAAILIFSAVGYETLEKPVSDNSTLTVMLKRKTTLLDEAVVIAYGKTTRRLNTGNVSRLASQEISSQPVANPLQVLEGRVPGLTVVQSSGLPGSSVSIQLRGQNSLLQGTEPLFIIDGVPFAPGNQNVNQLLSVLTTPGGGGLSPFSLINPADIESIEILKDADATAIYGSRGANGVVLITTKKAKAGKTNFDINLNTGWSKVTRTADMLNTKQYIQMRKEAFANDGITPTLANAPDLLAWDTTRYTDFKKMLVGGTAHMTNVQAAVSGGSDQTRFMVSAAGQKQTTVFPGDMNDQKITAATNLSHTTLNNKFSIDLSMNYARSKNTLTATGLAGSFNLPPNTPELYKPGGELNWEYNGTSFSNPLSYQKRKYTAESDNLISRLQLQYQILPGLQLRGSMGYNTMNIQETMLNPIASQNPANAPTGSAQFSYNRFNSWIAEPQFNYVSTFGNSKLDILVGGTYQQNTNRASVIEGGGYTNDALIQSLGAAPSISYKDNSFTDYRYTAFFGRLGYNYLSKYLLNFSGRRDGSSRFGPGRQFASFGSVGAAWLFSNEKFVKNVMPILSFGKLRASYGTSGNDQIGDYNYMDAWSVVQPYQGITSLYPGNLFNSTYSWEVNKKFETALELGLLNDRVFIAAAWFRNRSGNQLVQYVLPGQTGFFSITDNFPALVENKGWEFELSAKNFIAKKFSWTTNFNLTLPDNRLIAFPGLATSAYASQYVVGEPLNLVYKLKNIGVDPATGLFIFEDADKNGNIQGPADFIVSGNLNPAYYGGIGNNIRYGQFEMQLFFVFKKQKGANYLNTLYSTGAIPGTMNNQPVYVLDRWQKPGDKTNIQRFSSSYFGSAYTAAANFSNSDGHYSDASFARLRTASITYSVPASILNKYELNTMQVYAQAQNLFTFTNYKGSDPETQNLYALPPLRTIVIGLKLTF